MTVGPRAIDARHVGGVLVAVACVVGTVAARHDGSLVLDTWLIGFLYLALCLGPLHFVLRSARIGRALAATFLTTTVLCVAVVFCLPTTSGYRDEAHSVLSLLLGAGDLSTSAQQHFQDAADTAVLLLIVATLALWFGVMRLARRSRWAAIDHTWTAGSLGHHDTARDAARTSAVDVASPKRR